MIGKVGSKIEETGPGAKVSPEKGAGDSNSRPASATDTVNLTSSAQLLERLEKSLQTLPAIDSQRVAEVRSAIESGNFEIDAHAVADAMIRFERSFGE
jgi:negative regulator of flagellin synthesis FlgM